MKTIQDLRQLIGIKRLKVQSRGGTNTIPVHYCEACGGTGEWESIQRVRGGGNLPPEGYDEVELTACPICKR